MCAGDMSSESLRRVLGIRTPPARSAGRPAEKPERRYEVTVTVKREDGERVGPVTLAFSDTSAMGAFRQFAAHAEVTWATVAPTCETAAARRDNTRVEER